MNKGDDEIDKEKAELAAFAVPMGNDMRDDSQGGIARSTQNIAQENASLRQENAELKEQLKLITQQLSESMTALGRAMEYIKLSAGTGIGSQSLSDELVSERKEVQEITQTSSGSTDITAHVPYSTLPPILPVIPRESDEVGSMPTTSSRRNGKPAKPARPPRSRKKRPVPTHNVSAQKSETAQEKVTKPQADVYNEWIMNMFIASPQADFLQREVWQLHQATFPVFAPGSPLCGAEELIQKFPRVFPGAKLMTVGTVDKKYVVRGVMRK